MIGRPRLRAAALTLALTAALSGCASPGADPALTAAVGDALSATRSVQIDLALRADDRTLPSASGVVLVDMSEQLADAERQLALQPVSDPADAALRRDALAATRAALDGVRAVLDGHPGRGATAVSAAADVLADLAETG